jgi:type VI protein secretion system component VasA
LLYIVDISTGYRTQEFAPAVPCGSVVELDPDVAADAVARGYLIPEDHKRITEAHRNTLAAHRRAHSPARVDEAGTATESQPRPESSPREPQEPRGRRARAATERADG